jgi:aspartokinase
VTNALLAALDEAVAPSSSAEGGRLRS